jgi:HTH-type transcriptional regulator/antitoxin HigA
MLSGKELFTRGYFPSRFGNAWTKAKDRAEEMRQAFFCGRQDQPIGALNRQTTRKKSKVDVCALQAWRCRVLDRAAEDTSSEFAAASLNEALISQLRTLSTFDEGPVLPQKKLGSTGIAVVIEEHLPKTHPDGAALCDWQIRCAQQPGN